MVYEVIHNTTISWIDATQCVVSVNGIPESIISGILLVAGLIIGLMYISMLIYFNRQKRMSKFLKEREMLGEYVNWAEKRKDE